MGFASYLAIGYHDSAVKSVTKYGTPDRLPLYVLTAPVEKPSKPGSSGTTCNWV